MTLQHPHAELSAYIDGALAPAAQAAVDGHLVTCALCRAHVAELRATTAVLQALPDPVPSRRLVPRLAAAPAWLAPLRTLMTLASGAAVFLFIASSLVSNINFLASGGAAGTSASEASRDAVAKQQVPAAAAAPASTPTGTPAPVPTGSPYAPFAAATTASPAPKVATGTATDDSRLRADEATAGPTSASGAVASGAAAFNPQDAGRLASSEPQRSPLLNPWLWLSVAIVCAVIAIALHRRLRASV